MKKVFLLALIFISFTTYSQTATEIKQMIATAVKPINDTLKRTRDSVGLLRDSLRKVALSKVDTAIGNPAVKRMDTLQSQINQRLVAVPPTFGNTAYNDLRYKAIGYIPTLSELDVIYGYRPPSTSYLASIYQPKGLYFTKDSITAAIINSALGFNAISISQVPNKLSQLLNDTGFIRTSNLSPYLKTSDALSLYQSKGNYLTAITNADVTTAVGGVVLTGNIGTATFSQVLSTKQTFTVTHNYNITGVYFIGYEEISDDSAARHKFINITANSFDVYYFTPPVLGTSNIVFNYTITKKTN